ncbi:MAG: 1-(5-phosphoribosyl)-5-[(5-phosphoribosylamino)methylideneamino]imidazole-4-carboxamide isomerase [Deltaproteobacteria bacterium]|jgi:phosphoribosylformimino-5-aminoimidazole carboxamide ribotide isomerase|nr:MAG: 1-(5-phosphoribosyl)-5-[(5-phosphoribosylamino)methylideneamino]imidazole-4-carboxamide isomerase [Deltaproteobacteria bacterium]
MIIIPAIDLKEGKCVRLIQGHMDKVTVFSNDPAETAMRWEDRGAELIHIVDLDGSIAGSPKNTEVIEKIAKSINVPIQLGGGIRDLATINRYISIGVSRVIMGTMALEAPDLIKQACQLYPGRILVGIDANGGRVAIRGWTEVTKKKAVDAAKEVEGFGVTAFIFTDIKRDGMQTGPNIESTKKLAQSVTVPVIASGGVNTIGDIEDLMKIEEYGVSGVIVGRAIYTNSLRLEDAIKLTRES